MMRVYMILAVSIGMIALAMSGALAATTMWLSTSELGTPIVGNNINVASGASVELYAFMQSNDVGNTFELMVGYDKSKATIHGGGNASDAATGNLTLVSGKSDILASMPAAFNAFALAGCPDAGVVLNASGKEVSNVNLGGRPFGFLARAATSTNAAPGTILCFSFTLKNNMTTSGQSQYVVLSNSPGANSYSAAWKNGTSLSQNSYSLNVTTTSLRAVGATGKSLGDAVVSRVASCYTWVLWGKVSHRSEDSFIINDGSGVSVTVSAPGNSVADGDYVSVRGTLTNTDPPTLASQQISIYQQ